MEIKKHYPEEKHEVFKAALNLKLQADKLKKVLLVKKVKDKW